MGNNEERDPILDDVPARKYLLNKIDAVPARKYFLNKIIENGLGEELGKALKGAKTPQEVLSVMNYYQEIVCNLVRRKLLKGIIENGLVEEYDKAMREAKTPTDACGVMNYYENKMIGINNGQ